MFSLIWSLAPILVSTISFLTYVMLGSELTIGTAFTSIALFTASILISDAFAVISSWIIRVSLNCMAVYLEEDEFSAEVSSLKTDTVTSLFDGAEDEGLGLEHAILRWNELAKEDEGNRTSPLSLGGSTAHGDDNGRISVITGPTASGKTALLMALLGEMTLQPGGRMIMAKNLSKIDEHGNMHGISYAATRSRPGFDTSLSRTISSLATRTTRRGINKSSSAVRSSRILTFQRTDLSGGQKARCVGVFVSPYD
ncbi:hypothetical protein C8R47DRAFT_1228534 [Mycena vitilis]|nr:hypothetical protein C8R47DRAFT_1228534 [Mycena vitilis]